MQSEYPDVPTQEQGNEERSLAGLATQIRQVVIGMGLGLKGEKGRGGFWKEGSRHARRLLSRGKLRVT